MFICFRKESTRSILLCAALSSSSPSVHVYSLDRRQAGIVDVPDIRNLNADILHRGPFSPQLPDHYPSPTVPTSKRYQA